MNFGLVCLSNTFTVVKQLAVPHPHNRYANIVIASPSFSLTLSLRLLSQNASKMLQNCFKMSKLVCHIWKDNDECIEFITNLKSVV